MEWVSTAALRRLQYLLLVAVGLLASNLHWSASQSASGWAHPLLSLIYIPVVVAAVWGGVVSATAAALTGSALHVLLRALGHDCSWTYIIGETLLAVGIAWIAAAIAGRPAFADPSPSAERAEARSGNTGDVPDSRPKSALSRVIVGLVRQFGTPVASIEGAGWMLDDINLPEEKRREFVGIVRKESQRLSRILSEVSIYTRPRRPQFEELDLSALVDDVIQVASPKQRAAAVVIQKNIAPGLPRLIGDSELIRQALLNLVTNAVQATPPGGRVEVAARVDGGQFIIIVRDHGQGIPRTTLGRIFDPFYSTRQNGLGLGLPIAQDIVTEHGGRIAVDSVVDEGTCVSITLPVGLVR